MWVKVRTPALYTAMPLGQRISSKVCDAVEAISVPCTVTSPSSTPSLGDSSQWGARVEQCHCLTHQDTGKRALVRWAHTRGGVG